MYANTETDDNRPSQWFHINLRDEATAQAVQEALAAAGLTGQATAATFEKDGMILTARMAAFTWDSQAGAGDYQEEDDNDTPRLADLTDKGQDTFVEAVLSRASEYRGEMDMQELTSLLKATAVNATGSISTAENRLPAEEKERLARQDAESESDEGLLSASRIYDELRDSQAG